MNLPNSKPRSGLHRGFVNGRFGHSNFNQLTFRNPMPAREPLQGLANCTSVMEGTSFTIIARKTIHDKARSQRETAVSSITTLLNSNFLPTYIHTETLCWLTGYINIERQKGKTLHMQLSLKK